MENYQTDQSFQKQYEKYVKQVTPTHNLALQMLHAFVTGGAICTVGQIILNVAKSNGLDDAAAGSVCAILLVLASALLTGFNIYPSLVKWGGAGARPYLAGLAVGYWQSAEDITRNWSVDRVFCPAISEEERTRRIKGWNKAVRCAYHWARDEEE